MYVKFEKGQKFANPNKELIYSETPQDFEDCGYIIKDNELIVDIDNIERSEIEKFIQVHSLWTETRWTTRGVHLVFNRPENMNGSKGKVQFLDYEVEVEYKHSKNTPNGITIKRDGVLREIKYEDVRMDLPEVLKDSSAIYEIVPFKPVERFKGEFDYKLFTFCIQQLERKGYFDSYDDWYKFIFAICTMYQSGMITDEQAKFICTLIDDGNEKTFDMYERNKEVNHKITFGSVVKIMKDNGIEDITSVANVPQVIDSGDWWEVNVKGYPRFRHHIMSQYITQNFSIVRYGDESGILYYYDNHEGFYKMDADKRLLNQQIRTLDNTLTIAQVREVAVAIYEQSPIVKDWDKEHIPVKNGLWNIKEKKLVEFTPEVVIDYKIDINYNPFAQDDFISESLDKMSNYHAPTRLNLEECMGSVISPVLLVRFAWFMFGRTAHNGKTSFLYMIKQLLSEKFIGNLSPHDVARSQFKLSELYGKKANLIDEIGEKVIPDFEKIKTLITGGLTTIEFKGKGGFTANLQVPQVWCSNFFPNIREEGKQVDRRLEIIPFEYNFDEDKNKLPDYVSEYKASTDGAKEYILKLAIEGMYRLLVNEGQPTENEKRNEQKEEFKQNNDKLSEWLDDANLITGEGEYNEIDLQSWTDIYKSYTRWCDENEERFPLGKQRLGNELCKRYNLTLTKKRLIDVNTGKECGNPVKRLVLK